MPKASTSRRPGTPLARGVRNELSPTPECTRMYNTTTCFKIQEAMTEIKAIISQEIKIK